MPSRLSRREKSRAQRIRKKLQFALMGDLAFETGKFLCRKGFRRELESSLDGQDIWDPFVHLKIIRRELARDPNFLQGFNTQDLDLALEGRHAVAHNFLDDVHSYWKDYYGIWIDIARAIGARQAVRAMRQDVRDLT